MRVYHQGSYEGKFVFYLRTRSKSRCLVRARRSQGKDARAGDGELRAHYAAENSVGAKILPAAATEDNSSTAVATNRNSAMCQTTCPSGASEMSL